MLPTNRLDGVLGGKLFRGISRCPLLQTNYIRTMAPSSIGAEPVMLLRRAHPDQSSFTASLGVPPGSKSGNDTFLSSVKKLPHELMLTVVLQYSQLGRPESLATWLYYLQDCRRVTKDLYRQLPYCMNAHQFNSLYDRGMRLEDATFDGRDIRQTPAESRRYRGS